jgi:ribosomal protein S18 acetylase RimI-like enzyme
MPAATPVQHRRRRSLQHDAAEPEDQMSSPHLVITTVGRAERSAFANHAGATGADDRLGDLTRRLCPKVAVAARYHDGAALTRVIAGAASAQLRSPRDAEVTVWVADEWRRQGIGTVLLCELLKRLSARGVRRALALVEEADVAARRLFDGLGSLTDGRSVDGAVAYTVTVANRCSPAWRRGGGRAHDRVRAARPRRSSPPTAMSA